MATPYTDVYDFFLTKVTDYSFFDVERYPTNVELEVELQKYLRSAIIRFRQSKILLTKNDIGKEFDEDLGDEEKEILSTLMILSYIQPKIVSTQNMEQRLTDREYKSFSQGKHLEEMIKLRKELQSEVSQLISEYTYSDGLNGLF